MHLALDTQLRASELLMLTDFIDRLFIVSSQNQLARLEVLVSLLRL